MTLGDESRQRSIDRRSNMKSRSRNADHSTKKKVAAGIAATSFGTLAILVPQTHPASAEAPENRPSEKKTVPAPPLPRNVAAFLASQARVDAAAERLQKLGAATMADDNGIGGVVVSPAKKSVALYWHGPVPGAVQSAIAEIEGGGIDVEVLAAPFTHKELAVTRDSLRASLKRRPELTTLAILPDGSGLDVGTSGDPAHVTSFSAPDNIPVRMHQESRRPANGRWDDTVPFWGGAAYVLPSGSRQCSTGFGVHDAESSPPHYYMMTAAHCRETGVYHTPTGTVLGDFYESWENDDMIIDTGYERGLNDVTSGGITWGGGVDPTAHATNEVTHPVTGYSKLQVGDSVCTSGAFSGERCFLTVKQVDITAVVAGVEYQHMIQSEMEDHTNGAGSGDSGGPVYKKNEDGSVEMTGIISGIDSADHGAECTGIDNGRACSWDVMSSDAQYILDGLHLAVNTS
jgi:hypothetical protein